MAASSTSTVQYVTAGVATATQYGLPLFAYERSGQRQRRRSEHNQRGVQILSNRDPGMDTLVQNHIRNTWFGNGGNLFGYFGLAGAYSRYGDWGATDDYRNLTTPKYDALVNLTGCERNSMPFAPGGLVAVGGDSAPDQAGPRFRAPASYNVCAAPPVGRRDAVERVPPSTIKTPL